MHANPPDERLRVVAIDEEQLEGVHHDQDELDLWEQRIRLETGFTSHAAYHLQSGQVLLPPEVFLVLRTHGGEHVVGVHHDVDEGVEQAEEGAVTTCRGVGRIRMVRGWVRLTYTPTATHPV